MANRRMMPAVTTSSFVNSKVGGDACMTKRSAASTTRPSQCPDTRAWFTMRAHAAASAVATQGVLTPSTQASAPNIANRSASPNPIGVADAGKLGKENPSGVGRSSVAIGMVSCGAESPPPPPEHAEIASTIVLAIPINVSRFLGITLPAIRATEPFDDG